jgi:hypothetical protein
VLMHDAASIVQGIGTSENQDWEGYLRQTFAYAF